MKQRIFVFGASGHAKVVIDIIEKQKLFEIAFLVDDNSERKDEMLCGYSVIGGKAELCDAARIQNIHYGIVAIGNNHARASVARWLVSNGFELVTAVHPSAQIAKGVFIAPGTVLMAGSVLNSDVHIAQNAIINTCASVDHDCILGEDVHVAPGSTICGGVKVGSETLIGAGATVLPNISIGNGVVVGAGATVVADIADFVTAVGTPAKPVTIDKLATRSY